MTKIKLEDLNLVQHPLDPGQYIAEEFPKRQIYLHHTVGNPSGERTIDIWNNDRARIGTAVCISRDGTIGLLKGSKQLFLFSSCHAYSSVFYGKSNPMLFPFTFN